MNKRLLIFGFSCTSSKDGYAPQAVPLLKAQDPELEVVIAGLGGLAPTIVPPALDALFEQHGAFTHVLLEISTSIYARNAREDDAGALALLEECLERVTATGAVPALLLLYRQDLEPPKLRWNDMQRTYAMTHGILIIDLAEGLVAEIGKAAVERLLRDRVHTTLEGSIIQANRIAPRLSEWLRAPPYIPSIQPPQIRRRALSISGVGRECANLEREGFLFSCVLAEEGRVVEMTFKRPLQMYGFTFIYGPQSGTFSVSLNGADPFDFLAYDEFSYYSRLGARSVGPWFGRQVTTIQFTQRPEIPKVSLKKGEFSPLPRRGLLVSILHFERASLAGAA